MPPAPQGVQREVRQVGVYGTLWSRWEPPDAARARQREHPPAREQRWGAAETYWTRRAHQWEGRIHLGYIRRRGSPEARGMTRRTCAVSHASSRVLFIATD